MNEARDIPGVIAPPPLIALTTVLLGLALDWFLALFMLREIFSFWTRFIIGAVLITTGMATAGFGWGGFAQAGTNVEPWKPTLSLVTGGIFGVMLNPMYVGLMLLLGGLGVVLASDWMIILLIPAALILHFGVVGETRGTLSRGKIRRDLPCRHEPSSALRLATPSDTLTGGTAKPTYKDEELTLLRLK